MSTLKLEEVGRRRASYVSPAAQVFHVLALLERFLLRYLSTLLNRLLLRYWMCSLKNIIAEVFDVFSKKYYCGGI